MTKLFATIAAAGALALAATALPQRAEAGCNGPCVGLAILGGVAAAAVVTGAGNGAYPNDYYHPGYYGPSYEARPHLYAEGCYYDHARYWDQYRGVWLQGPPRLVCP